MAKCNADQLEKGNFCSGLQTACVGKHCLLYEEEKPKTNADHIRSLNDESLAKFIAITQIKQIEPIREQLNLLGIALKASDLEGDLQRVIIWLKQPFKEKEE